MAGDKPGPEQEVSDEELLRVLALAYKPALGTTEIADCVGLSRQAIHRRLKQLEDIRLVESGKFGSTRAWWLTDGGRLQVSESELKDPSCQ